MYVVLGRRGRKRFPLRHRDVKTLSGSLLARLRSNAATTPATCRYLGGFWSLFRDIVDDCFAPLMLRNLTDEVGILICPDVETLDAAMLEFALPENKCLETDRKG